MRHQFYCSLFVVALHQHFAHGFITYWHYNHVRLQGDRDLGSICKHEHLTATVAITDGGDEEEDSSLDLIRSYMVMILKCVQYLHEEVGVVHGDLKRK